MGLTPSLPQVRGFRDFSNSLPRNPYVINEWPLRTLLGDWRQLEGLLRPTQNVFFSKLSDNRLFCSVYCFLRYQVAYSISVEPCLLIVQSQQEVRPPRRK